ncbi:VTT domain-containing protein [Belnapia sp. T18]|uniref:VTT domain-containing protein n=1 Tax=Belnapia arida TaxID=2804533 RepID=A0ABS1UAJ3_9PROT|nr:VTT domain-containing protein [Belnapia arida]MBL6081703.1 VTT domain-containing protein [Belnapia arida]
MDPLGSLIEWAAPVGLPGLFAIGAMERIVPVLPSYGLLVAIGIGAADNLWPAPLAILAVTSGSTAAYCACYAVVTALGEARSRPLLHWSARLLGFPPDHHAHWVEACRQHLAPIAFGSQLVPTVRLLTPVIAGVLRAKPRTFLLASAAGIAVWNTLFIGLGFLAAQATSEVNASTLALELLAGLIAVEALAVLAWRRLRNAASRQTSIHP